jgi:hypothetical protein
VYVEEEEGERDPEEEKPEETEVEAFLVKMAEEREDVELFEAEEEVKAEEEVV